MIISKEISIKALIKWSAYQIVFLFSISTLVTLLYYFEVISMTIPSLSISVVGTAVAFYVGFKNNQAYERMWEARKIWGGIVNESRTWGMMVGSFISNLFADQKASEKEIHQIKKRLIYRHIGWLYAHRRQLLVAEPWEHINQGGHIGKNAKYHQENFGTGQIHDEVTKTELGLFISETEHERLAGSANTATQIVNEQSQDLKGIREQGFIDDFRQMEMENVLRSFYTLQGKNERIKKFPLPRQYAKMSRSFIGIFIFLLQFSLIPELIKTGTLGLWAAVPITVLISWVYVMMEIVGDYSENPFQGMSNDIPMLSLCKTIEIDLREMLGEEDLPAPIKAKNNILM